MERKTYKKLGFTVEETKEIVKHLNYLLANYHVHYQKLRNFHWNVRGRDFFELHEEFEKLYTQSRKNIDIVAERVKVFGQIPVSTLREYLEMAEIQEVGYDFTADQMVKEILNDFEMLLSFMMNVADAAIDIGDVGTEDMINTFIKQMEKTHWMYNSWLHEKQPELLDYTTAQ